MRPLELVLTSALAAWRRALALARAALAIARRSSPRRPAAAPEPLGADTLRRRGTARLRAGDLFGALVDLSDVLAAEPDCAQARAGLAELRERMGRMLREGPPPAPRPDEYEWLFPGELPSSLAWSDGGAAGSRSRRASPGPGERVGSPLRLPDLETRSPP